MLLQRVEKEQNSQPHLSRSALSSLINDDLIWNVVLALLILVFLTEHLPCFCSTECCSMYEPRSLEHLVYSASIAAALFMTV